MATLFTIADFDSLPEFRWFGTLARFLYRQFTIFELEKMLEEIGYVVEQSEDPDKPTKAQKAHAKKYAKFLEPLQAQPDEVRIAAHSGRRYIFEQDDLKSVGVPLVLSKPHFDNSILTPIPDTNVVDFRHYEPAGFVVYTCEQTGEKFLISRTNKPFAVKNLQDKIIGSVEQTLVVTPYLPGLPEFVQHFPYVPDGHDGIQISAQGIAVELDDKVCIDLGVLIGQKAILVCNYKSKVETMGPLNKINSKKGEVIPLNVYNGLHKTAKLNRR